MKILIVFDHFLKLVVEGQAGGLNQLGHDVKLLCRTQVREFGGNFAERERTLQPLRDMGIEVLHLPQRRLGLESIPEMRAVRRRLEAWRPDVVSAHENDEPRLLFTTRGWPLVYTVHDPQPHPGANRHPLLRLGAAAWMQAADRIVVHGSSLIPNLPARARRKPTHVIPHGIDVSEAPLPAPAHPMVLLFGRLEPYKGIGVLVSAMEHVWRVVPDARLVVAGRGPSVGEIPSDPRIELRDRYIAESEVPALFREASVTVLPYTQASQSGVGLLSIARGVPVIVSSVGALPDLALDNDCVVPPADPKRLADAVIGALGAGEAYRRQVLSFARERFAWTSVAGSYANLYARVAAEGQRNGTH